MLDQIEAKLLTVNHSWLTRGSSNMWDSFSGLVIPGSGQVDVDIVCPPVECNSWCVQEKEPNIGPALITHVLLLHRCTHKHFPWTKSAPVLYMHSKNRKALIHCHLIVFLKGAIYWTNYDLYSTLHNFALAINLSPIFDALQKVEYWFDMFTFTVIVMKENPISEHILLMSSYTLLKDRIQKLFGEGWKMSRFMVCTYSWYDEIW